MRTSANIMESTFCNAKDCPIEYTKQPAYMVMRKGQWVNVREYNKARNRNFKPKKIKV
jgi:hypothetical protein